MAPRVPFGLYVHVPFCAARCGYCDFNTYTAAELPGVSRASFAGSAIAELELARAAAGARPLDTVFFGGGTPTLLPPGDLAAILAAARELFGLAPGAEITAEANPESVDPSSLAQLRDAGFNRISIGMQSAAPHVLAVLDRVHTPGRAVEAAREARAAGFEQVSLDLIYGTPGESDEDWRATLDAALSAAPDHVSAYGLIVEPGTRLAARVRRGELPAPDDDAMARRYELADTALAGAGMDWYEVSNWAAGAKQRSRHNLGYWTGGEWWGAGPGAHSYLGGVRWWNERHPTAWARRVQTGERPEAGREVPSDRERRTERVMLELRTADGVALDVLTPAGRIAAQRLGADGLLDEHALAAGSAVLTLSGRLFADAAIRALDA